MKKFESISAACIELSGAGEDIRSQLDFLADALQAKVDKELAEESTTHPANWQMIYILNPVILLIRSIGLSADEQIADIRFAIDRLQEQGRKFAPA